jgi:2-(3-amino-3-carboxypropyl)histidine synthase
LNFGRLRLGDYELDLGYLLRELVERRARRVLVQLPEGLKRYYVELVDTISRVTGAEVTVDASPTYGSCLVDPTEVSGYDLVVHVGHDPYPLGNPTLGNVVYVDLEYVGVDAGQLAGVVDRSLRELGASRVAVLTTNQHKKLSKELVAELGKRGFTAVFGPALVLGCYLPPGLRESGAEVVLVVAGGRFHAVGASLVLPELRVLRVDPYTLTVSDASSDAARFLSIRLKKMWEAASARSWGILVGVAGQYRPHVVEVLRREFDGRGLRYYLLRAPVLDVDTLRNADSPSIEAYVVTSCPRVAVDDLYHFEKPVLTPPEALQVVRGLLGQGYPRSFI